MSEGMFSLSLRSLKLVYWQVRSAAHSTIQTALVAAAHVGDRTLQCDCAKHLNPAPVLIG